MISHAASLRTIAVALFAAVVAAGCATPQSADTVRRGETLRAQSVELGVVESVRGVNIEAGSTPVGTIGGAALGGIAGSTVGGGSRANAAGAIVGAILGGIAGTAIDRSVNTTQGVEVTVRLDSGRMIAVVQDGSPDAFRPGDRVRVTSDGQTTRVSR
jgi:outer membrane lipoprotein SlyB